MGTQNYINLGETRKRKSKQLIDNIENYRVAIVGIGAIIMLLGSLIIGLTDLGIVAVIGAGGIGFVMAILARPYLGMYVLTLFIFTNLSTVLNEAFGIPSLNKILVALIFVAVIGTRVVMQRKPLLFRVSEGAVLFYFIIVCISIVFSSSSMGDSFDVVLDVVKDFVIIFIIVQLATEESAWKNAQWVLIASAVVLSLMTWYQFLSGNYAFDFYGLATSRSDSVQGEFSNYIDFMRVGGPVGDPNFYAQILVMVMPLAIYRFITDPQKFNRVIGAVAALLIGGAIIFTYSRATLVVLIAVLGLIMLERRVPIYKIAIGGALILVFSYPLLPTTFKARMLTIVGIDTNSAEQDDVSTQGRLSEALVAIQMFQDYPVFGIGYAQYEPNYQSYSVFIGLDQRIEERQAHNMYLEVAGETGILGLFGLTVMLFFIYRAAMDTRRELRELKREDLIPWAAAFHFALIAYLINSIFLHDDYARYLRLIIGFVVSGTAMTGALRMKIESQKLRAKISYSKK